MDGAIQTPERENLVAPSFNKEEGSFEGKIGVKAKIYLYESNHSSRGSKSKKVK